MVYCNVSRRDVLAIKGQQIHIQLFLCKACLLISYYMGVRLVVYCTVSRRDVLAKKGQQIHVQPCMDL